MYALGAVNSIDPGNEFEDIELAGDLTTSCHESYTRTATKIGPEAFEFIHSEFSVPPRGAYYILRPGMHV
jgi:mannosyl-oligosaccharide alpha-1,2-mannosidase